MTWNFVAPGAFWGTNSVCMRGKIDMISLSELLFHHVSRGELGLQLQFSFLVAVCWPRSFGQPSQLKYRVS